jgi:hypothetical protein
VQLGDCLRRLCDSDLSIAGFYCTVDNPFGARFHAQRAVDEAHEAGDEARAQRAQALVDALPPPDPEQPVPKGGTP